MEPQLNHSLECVVLGVLEEVRVGSHRIEAGWFLGIVKPIVNPPGPSIMAAFQDFPVKAAENGTMEMGGFIGDVASQEDADDPGFGLRFDEGAAAWSAVDVVGGFQSPQCALNSLEIQTPDFGQFAR